MQNPLTFIDWMDVNASLNKLLSFQETLQILPMNSGFEAEVVKICLDKECFVLKTWNKSSKPDIQFQYQLLKRLSEYGQFVSKPVSWGIDKDGNQALLTPFDGYPLRKIDNEMLKEIATIFTSIHQIPIRDLVDLNIPKYEFINYFFPDICNYPDLYPLLIHIVDAASLRQDRLIHGDFHLENIVGDQGELKVIDWTNGQLGDSRYDFIWSLALSKIYNPINEFPPIFASTYLLQLPMEKDEIDIFEALAYMRWILLYRNGHVPVIHNTIKKVREFISNNRYLKEKDLL
ncbi:phosphotransferase [Bacillus niameyensis]|uniref:phosphotransferase n=1 Tax=Bacillus niameyensis TaxID=1522308 RepID=UPI000784036F|nr:aminoglycoside phosphotransferase family protein [Bacillus niameyensis]